MAEDMRLRKATENDLPNIVSIYNSVVPGHTATATLSPVTVEDWQPWLHDRKPQHPIWVIESGNSVVAGWMALGPYQTREAYHTTGQISIYIGEAWRGLGLGGWMLDQLLEMAPALGIKRIVALIFAHNAPSLTLFRRAGFEEWGYLPGIAELGGVERDVVIMGTRADII